MECLIRPWWQSWRELAKKWNNHFQKVHIVKFHIVIDWLQWSNQCNHKWWYWSKKRHNRKLLMVKLWWSTCTHKIFHSSSFHYQISLFLDQDHNMFHMKDDIYHFKTTNLPTDINMEGQFHHVSSLLSLMFLLDMCLLHNMLSILTSLHLK